MVQLGSEFQRPVQDYMLTRYGCCLLYHICYSLLYSANPIGRRLVGICFCDCSSASD